MLLFHRKVVPAVWLVSVSLLLSVSLPVTLPLLLPTVVRAQDKDLVRADAALSAAQKRVALVIGNKDYGNSPLINPVNDANAMGKTLNDLGFKVILKTNLTNEQMDEALDAFAQKLGPNTIGLFYFSGHGVQVDGANYLVPIGYSFKRQSEVKYHAFAAQQLLDTMGQTGCRCNIVILDACRNNPLPKGIRSAGSEGDGLGKMNAPSGTFIAYATAPGQTASDDPDKNNGLYTGVLLEKMKQPGLKIEDVFKATLVSVAEASGEKQVPWVESSLRNDFYFAAGLPSPAPVPVPTVVPGNGKVVETAGKLVVSVTDSKTGAAISGASVTVDGQSAPGGHFSLDLLTEAEKKVSVLVTAPNYKGQLVEGVTLLRGKAVSQSVALDALATPVPPAKPHPTPVPAPPPVAKVFTSAKLVATLYGHTKWVNSVAFSPDGSQVVTGSDDGTAKIWSRATGIIRRTLVHSTAEDYKKEVKSVAFRSDGKRIVTGSWDKTAKVWDATNGQMLVTLSVGYPVMSVAFSPNDRYIVTGDDRGTVALWDATKGKIVRKLTKQSRQIESVAFRSDGRRIVICSWDTTPKVWDLDTGKEVLTLKAHSSYVYSAAFNPDGSHIVTGSSDKTAKVWNAATGKVLLTLKHSEEVTSAAFSPDGRYIVTGDWNGAAKIWDSATGNELFTLTGHIKGVTSVAFRNSRYIATGSGDKTAKIWELQ